MANLLKGIAVSGEYVEGLKDKYFTVLKAPHYENVTDVKDPEKQIEKLVMFVELSDKAQLDYYPNKTSQKEMANQEGMDMDKWIGKRFKWKVIEQKVRGEMRKVIFVVDANTKT